MGDGSFLFDEEERSSKRVRVATGLLAGLGVLLVAVVLGLLLSGVNLRDKPGPSLDYLSESSTVACEKAVERQLKSPGSAKFGGETAIGGRRTFSVRGYVDSQNGFGALGRSTFHCGVEYDPQAKTYQITDFELT